MLKRAPVFLRVVEMDGKFDALDQIDDHPDPNETIYAYKITGVPGMCHLNMGRGRGGFYPIAEYAFYKNQPGDDVMRRTALWQEWCRHQPKEKIPG